MRTYCRNPDCVTHAFSDDAVVVFHLPKRQNHRLNQSAALIWNFLEAPKTLEEILNLLLDTYDSDRETLLRDAEEILGQMSTAGILL